MTKQSMAAKDYGLELAGRHSFAENVLEALGGDFDDAMKEAGFRGLDRERLNLPAELRRRRVPRRKSSATKIAALFGITVFVLGSFANAVIKNFVDDVWKSRVGPVLSRLVTKKKRGKLVVELPFRHVARIWFATERVMVSVIVLIERPEDVAVAEELIPVAFDKASLWLEQHGRTHTYLTYRIERGEVSVIPTLSEENLKA